MRALQIIGTGFVYALAAAAPRSCDVSAGGDAGACSYRDASPGPLSEAGAFVNPTGTYTNWFLPDNDAGYDNFAWSLNIEQDPSVDGVFWSTQFGFLGDVGTGYFGLQAHGTPTQPGQPPQKLAVFAIGNGALAAELGDVQPPSAAIGGDFDGNPGFNIHARYDWLPCHTYDLRVSFAGRDANGNIWVGAWIKDSAQTSETYIGRILIRGSGRAFMTYNVINFTEHFAPALSACTQQEHVSAVFGTLTTRTSDGQVLSAARHDNYFSSTLSCPGSRFTDLPIGVRHEMGVK